LAFVAFAGLVWLTRQKRGAFALFVALAAVSAGFVSAGWKSARVAGAVLERIRVTTVTGFIEQMDYRRRARVSSCGLPRRKVCRRSKCRGASG
jgi:competence protein ComEC